MTDSKCIGKEYAVEMTDSKCIGKECAIVTEKVTGRQVKLYNEMHQYSGNVTKYYYGHQRSV